MPRIFRPERSSAPAGELPATGPHTPPQSPTTPAVGRGAPVPALTGSQPSASNAQPAALSDPSPDGQHLSQAPSAPPGFAEQGRMRRRMRFLRKARELAYRDLGGLVFDLYRFGQRHDELVSAKLGALALLDAELRSIEHALNEHHGVTVLREAGVAACPRCAAIHSSGDRFCPSCGLPIGRHADRPIAAGPVGAPAPAVPRPAPAAPVVAAPAVAAPAPAPVVAAPAPAPAVAAPAPAPAPAVAAPTPAPAPAVAAPAQATSEPPTMTASTTTTNPSAPAEEEDQPTKIVRPPATGA